jgi:hypothetical protein
VHDAADTADTASVYNAVFEIFYRHVTHDFDFCNS